MSKSLRGFDPVSKSLYGRYFECTDRNVSVAPSMMSYMRLIIDTPIEGKYNLNGKVSDEVIGRKRGLPRTRIGDIRKRIRERLTKEEVLELCEDIMKEVA